MLLRRGGDRCPRWSKAPRRYRCVRAPLAQHSGHGLSSRWSKKLRCEWSKCLRGGAFARPKVPIGWKTRSDRPGGGQLGRVFRSEPPPRAVFDPKSPESGKTINLELVLTTAWFGGCRGRCGLDEGHGRAGLPEAQECSGESSERKRMRRRRGVLRRLGGGGNAA